MLTSNHRSRSFKQNAASVAPALACSTSIQLSMSASRQPSPSPLRAISAKRASSTIGRPSTTSLFDPPTITPVIVPGAALLISANLSARPCRGRIRVGAMARGGQSSGRELLERFVPVLRYDSNEAFFADAVELMAGDNDAFELTRQSG